MSTRAVTTESTAGIELASVTESVTAANWALRWKARPRMCADTVMKKRAQA
jgi:hypothetical protein